ncbi:MAG: PucC family protein, partial [Pseudomonadota bacterium]
ALNLIALWKQEPRNRIATGPDADRIPFSQAWASLMSDPSTRRLMWAIGLGAAGFSMQDVLLEPYGGEILAMSVSETTLLTAIFAAGTLVGFGLAARWLGQGSNPHRLASGRRGRSRQAFPQQRLQ